MLKIVLLVLIFVSSIQAKDACCTYEATVTANFTIKSCQSKTTKIVGLYKKGDTIKINSQFVDTKKKKWYKTNKGCISGKYIFIKEKDYRSTGKPINKTATIIKNDVYERNRCTTINSEIVNTYNIKDKVKILHQVVNAQGYKWYKTTKGCLYSKNISFWGYAKPKYKAKAKKYVKRTAEKTVAKKIYRKKATNAKSTKNSKNIKKLTSFINKNKKSIKNLESNLAMLLKNEKYSNNYPKSQNNFSKNDSFSKNGNIIQELRINQKKLVDNQHKLEKLLWLIETNDNQYYDTQSSQSLKNMDFVHSASNIQEDNRDAIENQKKLDLYFLQNEIDNSENKINALLKKKKAQKTQSLAFKPASSNIFDNHEIDVLYENQKRIKDMQISLEIIMNGMHKNGVSSRYSSDLLSKTSTTKRLTTSSKIQAVKNTALVQISNSQKELLKEIKQLKSQQEHNAELIKKNKDTQYDKQQSSQRNYGSQQPIIIQQFPSPQVVYQNPMQNNGYIQQAAPVQQYYGQQQVYGQNQNQYYDQYQNQRQYAQQQNGNYNDNYNSRSQNGYDSVNTGYSSNADLSMPGQNQNMNLDYRMNKVSNSGYSSKDPKNAELQRILRKDNMAYFKQKYSKKSNRVKNARPTSSNGELTTFIDIGGGSAYMWLTKEDNASQINNELGNIDTRDVRYLNIGHMFKNRIVMGLQGSQIVDSLLTISSYDLMFSYRTNTNNKFEFGFNVGIQKAKWQDNISTLSIDEDNSELNALSYGAFASFNLFTSKSFELYSKASYNKSSIKTILLNSSGVEEANINIDGNANLLIGIRYFF